MTPMARQAADLTEATSSYNAAFTFEIQNIAVRETILSTKIGCRLRSNPNENLPLKTKYTPPFL